jgi:hypothetical protein
MRAAQTTRLALCAALASAALFVPAAQADITVDPGGPAGKQYSALDDRARQQASGSEGSAGVPGSDTRAPLFGKGVGGDGPGDGGAGTPGPSGGEQASSSGDEGTSGSDAGLRAEIGLAVLAVLAAGGLLGLAMRRRTSLTG